MAEKQTKTKQQKARIFLKIALGIGVVCAPLFLAALVYLSFSTGNTPFQKHRAAGGQDWYAQLDSFDELFEQYRNNSGIVPPAVFQTILDKAEEITIGAEARLSLLKRRRLLAKTAFPGTRWNQRDFIAAYQVSAEKAAADFPHSAPIAAIASEALVMNAGLNEEGGAMPALTDMNSLERLAQVMLDTGPLSEAVYLPFVFSLYALSGAFTPIENVLTNRRGTALFASVAQNAAFYERAFLLLPAEIVHNLRENLLIDTALAYILNGKGEEALPFITSLDIYNIAKPNTLKFLANYYYDFGNLLLAGELFSRLKDAESIEMAACALYLAGEREEALRFWEIVPSLSAPKSDTQLRALYNSASLGSLLNIYAKKEYISSLEQLFLAVQDDTSKEGISIPALVLYTRLLPEERALAMLQSEERSTRYALLDLELFKRNAARAGIPRTAGETWFLLNRHPADKDIYQWAAWYFEYQKLYSDSEFLFHFAEQNNVSTPALVFNKSLYAMRNEDFSGAEKLFTQLKAALPAGASGLFRPKDGPWSLLWAANANLGIIYEARRAAGQALANYEEAVRLLEADFGHAKDRARLYLRIAHCYEVLGRRPEIRPLLEKALELDGENVNVHRALNRLTTRQD